MLGARRRRTHDKTQPGIFSVDDLADVGTDDGTPVANYGETHHFSGKLDKVKIELHPASTALNQADQQKSSDLAKAGELARE
jgi:hypothetical protein